MLYVTKIVIALILIGLSLSLYACGGGGAQIKILIPANQGNPFQLLLQNEETAAFYFKFIPLQTGFANICDTQLGSKVVWYPSEMGEGIPAQKKSFSIDDADLQEGVYYRVELYAKRDYNSSAPAQPGEFYGYPDCPLRIGNVSGHKVNICFGTVAPDPQCDTNPTLSATCAGMRSFSQCFDQ